jgi:myo-inositol-1(or 4)-monophosphatase
MSPDPDWLALCRRAMTGIRGAFQSSGDRGVETGRGEGGDMTLVIDRAAEDAVFAELEAVGVPLTAISEERGTVALAGGGPTHVVIDPVDGSLNAKRGLPFACLSIAVASGPAMADVTFGYVGEIEGPGEWWAEAGAGAFTGDERLPALEPRPLEIMGIETARPEAVAAAAAALGDFEAKRIRALGSVAATLCLVADGRIDAMLSLREVRSVDAAAGQLIVREAGGAAEAPASLFLDRRARVFAARDRATLERLRGITA